MFTLGNYGHLTELDDIITIYSNPPLLDTLPQNIMEEVFFWVDDRVQDKLITWLKDYGQLEKALLTPNSKGKLPICAAWLQGPRTRDKLYEVSRLSMQNENQETLLELLVNHADNKDASRILYDKVDEVFALFSSQEIDIKQKIIEKFEHASTSLLAIALNNNVDESILKDIIASHKTMFSIYSAKGLSEQQRTWCLRISVKDKQAKNTFSFLDQFYLIAFCEEPQLAFSVLCQNTTEHEETVTTSHQMDQRPKATANSRDLDQNNSEDSPEDEAAIRSDRSLK